MNHLARRHVLTGFAGLSLANPTGQNYDAADAQVAWDRTVAFLKANLS